MPKETKNQADDSIETTKPQDGGREDNTNPTEKVEKIPEQTVAPVATQNRFKILLASYWRRRLWTLPVTLLVVVAVVLAVPATRYPVLGLFLQRDYMVFVTDAASGKPVSKAQVTLGSTVTQTDAEGKAKLRSAVGKTQLDITKKYYAASSRSVLVPVKQKDTVKVVLRATGRQVPVSVMNRISGKPLSGATLAAADTEVKTDKDGKAVIVLPADKQSVEARLTADGFNQSTVTILVSEQADKNTFQLTPSGRVYFLSKQSGTIDVVSTNLDGSERQTVLAGTGKENQVDTTIAASSDWKYLALKSRRDGGVNNKLFLINTSNNKITTIDEGNAYFTPAGWSDHHFVYTVYRLDVKVYQPRGQAIKTYDADSGRLTLIDETEGDGLSESYYTRGMFGPVSVLANKDIFYARNIQATYGGNWGYDRKASLIAAKADGSGKRTVRDVPLTVNAGYYTILTYMYGPNGVYVQVPQETGEGNTFYDYQNGNLLARSDMNASMLDGPIVYASPSGSKLVRGETRDGKSALIVSNADGSSTKQVASLSGFSPLGWYDDQYLLVAKNDSELYVMTADGSAPIKIADYHQIRVR